MAKIVPSAWTMLLLYLSTSEPQKINDIFYLCKSCVHRQMPTPWSIANVVCGRILTLCLATRFPAINTLRHLWKLSFLPSNLSRVVFCVMRRAFSLFQTFQGLLEDADHWWRCLFTNFSDTSFFLQLKLWHVILNIMNVLILMSTATRLWVFFSQIGMLFIRVWNSCEPTRWTWDFADYGLSQVWIKTGSTVCFELSIILVLCLGILAYYSSFRVIDVILCPIWCECVRVTNAMEFISYLDL